MGKGKKKKTVKRAPELTDNSVPRSFIFHRGEVGKFLSQLVVDMRRLMEPYTATNLKVNKNNVLKDFVNVAGPYGISHFIIFTKTEMSPYIKICRLPRGPTLTFKLEEYSLMRDVTAILKRPKTIGSQFKFPPLVVLNNFNSESLEMKLMTTVFQNMFPAIKVQKVKLSEIRRCAMFNYDKESGCIDFRHYNIEATPVGVSRGVKKLLKNKIPNLGSLPDISDFMSGAAAYLSESEGEEPTEAQVTLPQHVHGRGNIKSAQSAIRLTEMGPRMKLFLIKIEEGVSDGEVLFHRYEKKTQQEKKALRRKKEEARKLKEKRKKEQEKNMEKKEKEKELNKERSLAGMKRKADEDDEDDDEESDNEKEDNEKEDDDDDAEYYRQEVGDEPDDDLLQSKPKKKKYFKQGESESKISRKHSEHNKKLEKTVQKRHDISFIKNKKNTRIKAKVLSKRPIKEGRFKKKTKR